MKDIEMEEKQADLETELKQKIESIAVAWSLELYIK